MDIVASAADFNPASPSPAYASGKITAAQIREKCAPELAEYGKRIAVHLKKADQYADKAEQHRLSAGQYLALAADACDEGGFDEFRERFCPKVGRSRAYDLKSIAAGNKTIEQIRAETRDRVARHRAKKKSVTTLVTDGTEIDHKVASSPDDPDQSAEDRKALYEPQENDGDDRAGGNAHHDAVDNGNHGEPGEPALLKCTAEPKTETPLVAQTRSIDFLHEVWGAATTEERRQLIQGEPVANVVALLSDAQHADLFDLLVGLQIASAAPIAASKSSKRLLVNLTGTLLWALGQNDPALGADGLKRIKAKLAANNREPKDLCLTFAKRR